MRRGRLVPLLAFAIVAFAFLIAGAGSAALGSAARCGWKPIVLPRIKGADLHGVVARTAKDVWFVGTRGPSKHDRTLVLHFNGHAIRVVPSPNPAGDMNELWDVLAFSPSNAWAVGTGWTEGVYRYTPLVLHYDGQAWKAVSTARVDAYSGSFIYAIDGTSPFDIWIVGDVDRASHWAGLIEHWDGLLWRVVPGPEISRYATVTAISRTNSWAAGGQRTRWADDVFRPAHWDGRGLKLIKDASGTWQVSALGSSASGPRNVWIVGSVWGEPWTPFAERFDGKHFRRIPVPFRHWKANYNRNKDSDLLGVAAISPRNVWAVGTFGIEHYDGRSWQLISHDSSYSAIDALSPADIWAVGGTKAARFRCAYKLGSR